ncbi:MAG: serine/threonine-protein kinase [Polyangiales bacterium]
MLGSSGVPQDTEGARAFQQERVALFAKNVSLITFVFWCFSNAALSFTGVPPSLQFVFLSPGNRMQLFAVAVMGAVWAIASRGVRSSRALLWLDAGGTFLATSAFVALGPALAMHSGSTGRNRMTAVVVLVLFTYHWLRAVLVPSSGRRTLAVTAASAIPLLALAVWVEPKPLIRFSFVIIGNHALWCAVLMACASMTSRVIYGLRAEVREAQKLGQYTLEEKIGAGGMGSVYRARHAMLRRPTAVKLLDPERAGRESLARFEREVQLTSQLTHPNTVAIYDYGRTPDGVFYYAMEYLDGLDLQDVIEVDGPQSPARVVHILSQVCAALAEAHAIGLVHRDIKPANVLLCSRGGSLDVAKVVDFGLVKRVEGADAEDSAKSAIGTIIGTPLYMSPESIVTPDAVDARSDLYAVGALGYFLLTGSPPFEGATVIEVCSRHLHAEPEPPSVRLGKALPTELEALLLACLAKKPEERPASARALRDALVALPVPAWSEADARAWWARHEKRTAKPRTASSERRLGSALTVDVRDRAS